MSTILPSDIFLVNKDGISSKVLSGNLLAIDFCILLVNRNGTSYRCPNTQLANKLLDSDILLINRDGLSHKVLGRDVKGILNTQLTGLNWIIPSSNTQLWRNSGPLSEAVMIDEDPSTGVALEGIGSGGPQLRVAGFTTMSQKYMVAKIIYDPHNNDFAGAGWAGDRYSINEIRFITEANDTGITQYTMSVTQKENTATQEITIPEEFNAIQANGVRNIYFINSASNYLAVGGLRIYFRAI